MDLFVKECTFQRSQMITRFRGIIKLKSNHTISFNQINLAPSQWMKRCVESLVELVHITQLCELPDGREFLIARLTFVGTLS